MQRRGEFRVSVTKDYLVFASAHFITFAGHRCEGLHGHNYRASVTLEGIARREKLVRVRLRGAQDASCAASATRSTTWCCCRSRAPGAGRAEDGERRERSRSTASRATSSPRRDCALLPIPNTTVEMLAEMLTESAARRARDGRSAEGVTAIEMEVEENFGQSAVYRFALRLIPPRARDVGGAEPAIQERRRDKRAVAAGIGEPREILEPADTPPSQQRQRRHGIPHAQRSRTGRAPRRCPTRARSITMTLARTRRHGACGQSGRRHARNSRQPGATTGSPSRRSRLKATFASAERLADLSERVVRAQRLEPDDDV